MVLWENSARGNRIFMTVVIEINLDTDLIMSRLQSKKKYQRPTKSELRFKPRGQGYTCDLCDNSMIIYNTKQIMSHHLRTYHAFDFPQVAQYNLQKVGTSKPVETHISIKYKTTQNSEPLKDMSGRHNELSLLNYKTLGNHECPKCSEKFVLKFSLLKHQECHGGNSLFKCQVKRCDYSNDNAKVISKHMKRAHPENIHPMCPYCYVKFFTMNDLKVHTNENMQLVAIVCGSPQCQMRFEAKCGLKIHKREKHRKEPEIEESQEKFNGVFLSSHDNTMLNMNCSKEQNAEGTKQTKNL